MSPCVFCGEMKVDLRAHFLSVHQEEEKIKELSTLGKKERIQAIAALRRQGILQKNMKSVASGGDTRDLMCERKSSGEKVMWSRCSGVFKEAYFYKHKKTCLSPRTRINRHALDVRFLVTLTNPRPTTEWDTVMEKMDKDRFFDIIKSDEVIISANISTTPGNLQRVRMPKSRHAQRCVDWPNSLMPQSVSQQQPNCLWSQTSTS